MARKKYSEELRERMLKHYRGKCQYCLDAPADTLDHIVPISKGGEEDLQNVIPMCRKCNEEKGDELLSPEKTLSLRLRAANFQFMYAAKKRRRRRR